MVYLASDLVDSSQANGNLIIPLELMTAVSSILNYSEDRAWTTLH